MKVDYDQAFKEQLSKNVEAFKADIQNGHNLDRLINFAQRYGLDVNDVIYKAQNDDVFALGFVKDPARQNFHENFAAEYIKNLPSVTAFEQLPKGGRNAKTVISGMVVDYLQAQQTHKKQKTIDFEFNIVNSDNRLIKVYASHKYTKDSGGAQDNQYENLINFMEHAKDNRDKDVYFLAICDGPYFQKTDAHGLSKIERLNDMFYTNNKLKAITIEDIETTISDTLNKCF